MKQHKAPRRFWTSTGYYEEGPKGTARRVATPYEEREFRRNIAQINANCYEAEALAELIRAARDVADAATQESLARLRLAVENHNRGGVIRIDDPKGGA